MQPRSRRDRRARREPAIVRHLVMPGLEVALAKARPCETVTAHGPGDARPIVASPWRCDAGYLATRFQRQSATEYDIDSRFWRESNGCGHLDAPIILLPTTNDLSAWRRSSAVF
jgi:hypothetical protein